MRDRKKERASTLAKRPQRISSPFLPVAGGSSNAQEVHFDIVRGLSTTKRSQKGLVAHRSHRSPRDFRKKKDSPLVIYPLSDG